MNPFYCFQAQGRDRFALALRKKASQSETIIDLLSARW
jgi:hypothetical protein